MSNLGKRNRLEQLVYVSTDTGNVTNAIRAADILAEARRNNARDDITGVLTFCSGRFIQILEGRTAVIEPLLDKLRADRRHRDLQILGRRDIPQRDFPTWDMVSPRLAPAQINELKALLADNEAALGSYVEVLSLAVESQAETLTEYGYDPRPEPPRPSGGVTASA